jgi:hypothetical protein
LIDVNQPLFRGRHATDDSGNYCINVGHAGGDFSLRWHPEPALNDGLDCPDDVYDESITLPPSEAATGSICEDGAEDCIPFEEPTVFPCDNL